MHADIIETMPWQCGDRDCVQQWHLANYWTQDDGGYTVDNYADGDHESIDQSDLPAPDAVLAAWREYHAHVAATGDDPLSEFTIPRTRVRREKWRVRLVPTIAGLVAQSVRHAGRTVNPYDLPGHVRDYLQIDSHKGARPILRGVEIADLPEGWKLNRFETFYIDHACARSPETITRDLKRAARRALRRAR